MSSLSLALLCTTVLSARVSLTDNHGPFIPASKPIKLKHTEDVNGGTIVLMTHDGRVLADPVTLGDGTVTNLTDEIPLLATIDEAVYLQLIRPNGQAVNAPLVIEPALSRRVPITEQVDSPERGTWTKIVGWQDEGALDRDDLPDGAGRIDTAALATAVPRDDAVVRSGWWVYPERDVRFQTDHGELWIDLREDVAPGTCRNFRALAGMSFYTDTVFHRIINEGRNGRPFVIQGGDPNGTGDGGPGWWLPLEPSHLPHDYGVVSMARVDDPDSAGSQWFIALDRRETARLDGQYCAFAEVIKGTSTIESMRTVELADTDYLSSRPVHPPRIELVRIAPAPPRIPGTGRVHAPVRPPSEVISPTTTE